MNRSDIGQRRAGFLRDLESCLEEALGARARVPRSDLPVPDPAAGPDDPALAPLLEAARHLCLSGGKRVRPQVVHSFSEALSAPAAGAMDVAVAAELIHSASLLHDDVIDGGSVRRGRATANAAWGNLVAVLAGDLVLTIAFEHLRRHPHGVYHGAVAVVAAMTRATMAESAARGRLDLDPAEWRIIAEGKTGALFGWCGGAVAALAGDDGTSLAFSRCGWHLGVAFQLADDLDDLLGQAVGKDCFADVRNRNPSFPILCAAGRSGHVRRALTEAWAAPVVDPDLSRSLGRAVVDAGGAECTWRAIGEELEAAGAALGPFGAHPALADLLARAESRWRARST